MATVRLETSDHHVVTVAAKVARVSELVKQVMDSGNGEYPILLHQVDYATLVKVLQWAERHQQDQPLPPVQFGVMPRTEDFDDWDAAYMQEDLKTITKLILAAHYMKIEGLLRLTCKTVANILKENTPEELRTLFQVENDFSEEELAQLTSDYESCKDFMF